MAGRFTLGSTSWFTAMAASHGTGKLADSPLVTVAQSSAALVGPRSLSLSRSLVRHSSSSLSQSSAALVPHLLAGCDPRRVGVSRTRAEAALQPASALFSTQELRRRPTSAKAPRRSLLPHHGSVIRKAGRANLPMPVSFVSGLSMGGPAAGLPARRPAPQTDFANDSDRRRPTGTGRRRSGEPAHRDYIYIYIYIYIAWREIPARSSRSP